MKIVVKVEKAGQPLAEFEYELEREIESPKGAAKALNRLCKANPNISLFDSDVRVKFEKAE